MKVLVGLVLIIFGVIGGIGVYLSPDDLARCDQEPSERCRPADAVVAVSGGDTYARAKKAIDLYQNGWSSTLVFSGAAQDKSGPSNAATMRSIARDAGVPAEDIVIEEASATTKENAELTYALLAAENFDSIILVTSGYHQRRASLEFNRLMAGDVSIRNHAVEEDRQWSGDGWWLTKRGWYLAISELSKIVAFYLGSAK